MSDIAIRVKDLTKAYTIGLQEEKSETFASALGKSITAPIRNFRRVRNLGNIEESTRRDDTFYALTDLSFDIKQGEAVSIIGHNGAGKSTLLKIISRITDPTAGRIEIYGRVSSLLEVGTGFHPDLTGRENVYLNGTILGMRKSEIDDKFEEILDFSGVRKHIDTPVKRYSSGMRVRLAFAVAAHLEAEILLIDEVLAVGDVEFQKKCLGKMNEVTSQGRTVLFVSHNMGAIKELCTRGIVLDKGHKVFDGPVNDSIIYYLEGFKEKKIEVGSSGKPFTMGRVLMNDEINPVLSPSDPVRVNLKFAAKELTNPKFVFIIEDFMGQELINLSHNISHFGMQTLDGEQNLELTFPPLWLAPGIYSAYFKVDIFSQSSSVSKVVSEKIFFDVSSDAETVASGFHSGKKHTILAPPVQWKFSEASADSENQILPLSSNKATI
jgi:lipopolysaccharide transport system ATP-binding protein